MEESLTGLSVPRSISNLLLRGDTPSFVATENRDILAFAVGSGPRKGVTSAAFTGAGGNSLTPEAHGSDYL